MLSSTSIEPNHHHHQHHPHHHHHHPHHPHHPHHIPQQASQAPIWASSSSYYPFQSELESKIYKALQNGANPSTLWTKLFVGGLPYHTTDAELRRHFEQFGTITEAAIIVEKEVKKSKGFGFVSKAIFFSNCTQFILFSMNTLSHSCKLYKYQRK